MTSILCIIARICRSQFKYKLSKKQTTFAEFFPVFLKFTLNFKYFQKKDEPHRFRIPKLEIAKDVARQISKKTRFTTPFDSPHLKHPNHLWNLQESTFITIFHHSGWNCFEKCLS